MYLANREISLRKATLDVVLFVFPESSFGLKEDLGGRCDIDVVDGLKTLSLGIFDAYVLSKWFKSDLSQYVHCCGNNYGLC